jgi:hypothetical protein
MELEEWAMTFQKIELDDKDASTSMADDWTSTQ